MRIKLSYTGYLKFEGVETGSMIEVDEGSSVGDLLSGFDVAREHQRFLKLFVNDEAVGLDRVLEEGDELTVIMQIGGG